MQSEGLSKTVEASEALKMPAWLLTLGFAAGALIIGFGSGGSLVAVLGGTTAVVVLTALAVVPLSMPLKLTFLLICITFLQKTFGYVKFSEMRGVNLGNLLLAAAFLYWAWRGLSAGVWYRRNPLDFWLFLAVLAFPLFSIYHTAAYGRVPGYSSSDQLSYYKQWVVPFVYFFLLCQCLEKKKDIQILFFCVFMLIVAAVVYSLPDVLRFSDWKESRTEGFLQQANDYAALLGTTAPVLLMVVFLLRGRPLLRGVSLLLLAGMALSMLTTYSRAGYVAFGLALVGSVYLVYRGTGMFPLGTPTIVICVACLMPLVVAPQLLDNIKDRLFVVENYKRAKRQSYSQYRTVNAYTGDRLELWQQGFRMAEEYPIVGVGFNGFILKLWQYRFPRPNHSHSMYIGALATGGIVWLLAFLVLYWRILRVHYVNWINAVRDKDLMGQVICGGALVSFCVMLWFGLTMDFLNPAPKNVVFWVMMAGGINYGFLPEDAIGPDKVPAPAPVRA